MFLVKVKLDAYGVEHSMSYPTRAEADAAADTVERMGRAGILCVYTVNVDVPIMVGSTAMFDRDIRMMREAKRCGANVVRCIKWIRESYGSGLKEAKDAWDSIKA